MQYWEIKNTRMMEKINKWGIDMYQIHNGPEISQQ